MRVAGVSRHGEAALGWMFLEKVLADFKD